jgi:alkylation response protein AidB-like acyl-CoA dehydrogenase
MAEREELVEYNEQFSVDNQFLKKRADKAEADNARLRDKLADAAVALDAAFLIVRKASVAAKMDAVNASPSDPTALQRETWMRKCDAALELVVSARAALNGEETK